MSYIEREATLELIQEAFHKTDVNGEEQIGVLTCHRIVREAPIADVVEVVRCKDCKYYEIHKPTITLNCEREGKLVPMMPNDYCSYGERS